MESRDFCKPLNLTKEQRKQIKEEFDKLPNMEFWFNCHLDCLIYENGVLVGKQKKGWKVY